MANATKREETAGVLRQAEQRISWGVLHRIFSPSVAEAVFNGFYLEGGEGYSLLEDIENESTNPHPANMRDVVSKHASGLEEAPWLRFEVLDLKSSHFIKSPFPTFTISLVQNDGQPIDPPIDQDGTSLTINDVKIRIEIHNKWANVTEEVLGLSEVEKVLVNGKVCINDWVFRDVSHKHGGYFKIHIVPLDFVDEIVEWWSVPLIVHSDRSLRRWTANN
eukprot:c1501_g1_i1.p1 GENE.c1501_g1_i1~~c1501_g1_i1.p1  ORF type:complete len:229 (+),score=30.11 c1501_g1_i1:28-687(+)